MGSSKSLKTPAFLKKSDLLLFFSSMMIGLKRWEFSNFWKILFTVRIGSLYQGSEQHWVQLYLVGNLFVIKLETTMVLEWWQIFNFMQLQKNIIHQKSTLILFASKEVKDFHREYGLPRQMHFGN